MQIAIISDSHDNMNNIQKALDFCSKNAITTIIHCGDVTTKDTALFLDNNFAGQIYLSLGNCDQDHDIANTDLKNFKIFNNAGNLEIAGLKIGFCHFPELAKESCPDYDFFFYGHTHKPWIQKIGNCQLANPGTLGGVFYKPSFAILDCENKKLDLKLLELI